MKLKYFTSIKFLGKYIKKNKINFLVFYIGWFIDSILSLAMPLLIGILIDEIVYYKNINTFMQISLVIVGISLFSCILYFLIYSQHHLLMSIFTFNIKRDIFNHYHHTTAEYLSNSKAGDTITNIQKHSTECMNFIIRNVIHNFNNILLAIFYITYIFLISWKIALLFIIAIPITILISTKYGKKIRTNSDNQREYYNSYISWLMEVLSAIKDIRLLCAESIFQNKFRTSQKKLYHVDNKMNALNLAFNSIIKATNLIIQLSIFAICAYLSSTESITIGTIMVLLAFYAGANKSATYIANNYLDAQKRISSIQSIYDFMQSPTESWNGNDTLTVEKGNIIFSEIEFAYKDSNQLLKKFSFNIQPGEKVAFVGQSGCGKTTLAYMLIGFYKPQNGYIMIDGQMLNECTLKSIRNQIGIIQQDVLIFEGTIKENLLLGNHNAKDSDIKDACDKAGISTFIESLPDGYHTKVNKNGLSLSGGQKQRISIARIYLRNPKIIVFDEATSSLDADTEEQIHEAWNNVLKNRTCIIIAHRLSSVLLCDKAAVIEDGIISDIGDPKILAQVNETFRTLFAIKEVE